MIICVLISGLLTFIRQQNENIATNIVALETTNSSVIRSSKTQQSGNKTPRRSQSRMTYINEVKHFSRQTKFNIPEDGNCQANNLPVFCDSL